MATTGTKTVRDIVTAALRKINVVSVGEQPAPEDAEVAVEALNRLLKVWQNKRYLLWTYENGSVPLVPGSEQTLSPVRPIRIVSMRFKQISGVEIPMQRMTRNEYDNLPLKSSTGTPTTFYYDRQREDARLYVWPSLSAVTTETLKYSYEREFEDITDMNGDIEVPSEWWDVVVYNLGAMLADDFQRNVPNVLSRAQMLLSEALGADLEESVFWGEEC